MDEGIAHPGLPRRRRFAIFAVVSVALLMSSLDQTIIATALDAIGQGTGASLAWASWTLTIYSLGTMVMLPLAGTLSERFGQRRVFLISVIVFTGASLACGLADNIHLLIAFRALQAIGGAGFTPSATGIVVRHFGRSRDRAVGLFGSIFPIGATLGPAVGGILVTYGSWRSVFFVNVPVGIVMIPLVLHVIPRDQVAQVRGGTPLDLRGMALLAAAVLAGMVALTALGNGGPGAWPVVISAGVAVALCGGLFVRHVIRAAHPFIAPRLIFGRGFGAVNAINVIYGGAVAGLISLVPVYLVNRYGMNALQAGSVLAAEGIAVIVCSTAGAYLLRRTGYRAPLYAGSLVAALGVGALAGAPSGVAPYLWMAAAGSAIGVGLGWSNPASRNAGLQLAPEHASSIAALRSMGRQVGKIISVSAATAIVAGAEHHGQTQAYVYAAAALVLVVTLPVIARIPDHRGAW